MQRTDKQEAGLREIDRRYRAIVRIVSALNTDRPIEDVVQEIGEVLHALIPCDRFSLGLVSWDRWYFLEDGRLTSRNFSFPLVADNSASEWVIHNRRPLLRRDISKGHRFRHDVIRMEQGDRSDLIVPLVVDGEVMGTFNFTSRASNRYDEGCLEGAQSVADAVAVAVKQFQARLEMEAIREISDAVLRPLELDEVLKMVLTHIQSQGYDQVRLYLYDQAQHAMVGALLLGMEHEPASIVYPLKNDPYSKQTLASDRPRIYRAGTPEYEEVVRRRREMGEFLYSNPDILVWCEMPLKVVEEGQEVIVGKIALDNSLSRRPLAQERLDRLMVYASQAAIAIRHAQLYRQMAGQVERRTAELNEQNRQQEALLHINRAVQEVSRPADLEGVVQVCYDRLKALGLDFQALVIHRLIDRETLTFESYEVQPSGKFNRLVMERANVYRMWQGGRTVYRPDLEVDMGGMALEDLEATKQRYGVRSRCVLDVPHPRGTLALMSVRRNAFSRFEVAFVEQVTEVLSVGISRVEDLERVEAHARALRESQIEQRQADEQLLEYQAQLRSLASELTLTEERERRRLATDLHDRIGQTLAVSKIKLGALGTSAASTDFAGPLDEVRALIDQTIQDTRSLTFELSLPVLYELGFTAAMEWLAEQVQEQHGVRVELEVDGQVRLPDEGLRVLLFRAVQELLVNVVKHAQAHTAKISIREDGDSIRIEVEDDGIGFEPSKAGRNGGFGFFSVRERLRFLGGDFDVESEPGRGTRAVLVAPLKDSGESPGSGMG